MNKLILENDGEEKECKILFTRYSEDFDRHYVIFEIEEDVPTAACYNPDDRATGPLLDIETDEEWEMIDEWLDEFYEDLDSEE